MIRSSTWKVKVRMEWKGEFNCKDLDVESWCIMGTIRWCTQSGCRKATPEKRKRGGVWQMFYLLDWSIFKHFCLSVYQRRHKWQNAEQNRNFILSSFPPPCLTENKYKERNNRMEDMKVKTWCSERHPETRWRKTTWSPLLPFLLVLPLRLPSVSLLCCGFSSCNNMSHVHITEWSDNSVCVCWCKH